MSEIKKSLRVLLNILQYIDCGIDYLTNHKHFSAQKLSKVASAIINSENELIKAIKEIEIYIKNNPITPIENSNLENPFSKYDLEELINISDISIKNGQLMREYIEDSPDSDKKKIEAIIKNTIAIHTTYKSYIETLSHKLGDKKMIKFLKKVQSH